MKYEDFNKGQRLLLEEAKKQRLPIRLRTQMFEAVNGKAPCSVDDLPPLRIIDNTYDGPEDRTDEFRFNPENKANRMIFFLCDKFGVDFGFIYFLHLSAFAHHPEKEAEKFVREFMDSIEEDGFYENGSEEENQ
ncbi:hypothetical protein ES703_04012 [subsurface metagenome]